MLSTHDYTRVITLEAIEDYITPLTQDEFLQLEQNLLREGCRDPIIVWRQHDDALVIVDGHHRHKICQRLNIPFRVAFLSFNSVEEAQFWMIENQIGRRNLKSTQKSYYRGVKYLLLKRKKGGYENIKLKGKNRNSTSEFLASHFSVSESTVKRDAKFAEGLDILGKRDPNLRMQILSGQTKVKKADIEALACSNRPNKDVNALTSDTVYQGRRKIVPPRILEIKRQILKGINQMLEDGRPDAINDIKNLVDQLEKELFYCAPDLMEQRKTTAEPMSEP